MTQIFAELTHQWEEVARIEAVEGGDGQTCVVEMMRTPAKFYRVRALAAKNSVGAPVTPFVMQTGSGDECRAWAIQTANLVARGMVGIG